MGIDDEVIARGERLSVMAMDVEVMDLDDILITKLMALDEHSADYGADPITRSCASRSTGGRCTNATARSRPSRARSSCSWRGWV